MNNWVFSSDLANPINIDKNDRRFSPLTSVALQANMSNTKRLTILVAKINRKQRHIYIEPGINDT